MRRLWEQKPHAPPSDQAWCSPGLRLAHRRIASRGAIAPTCSTGDELRLQTGADWCLITDGPVCSRPGPRRGSSGEDLSRGARSAAPWRPGHPGALARAGRKGRRTVSSGRRSVANPGSTTPFGVVVSHSRSTAGSVSSAGNNDSRSFSSRSTRWAIPRLAVSSLHGTRWPRKSAAPQLGKGEDTPSHRFRFARGTESDLGASGFLRTSGRSNARGFLGLHSRDQELAATAVEPDDRVVVRGGACAARWVPRC